MSRLASWVLCVVMTAGIGCAHSRPFTPPEDGGPAWLELTSPHFVVRTDLPEATGQSLAVALERSYGLLADIAFPYASKPEGRTQVLVVRSQEEYDLLGVPGSAGFYRRKLDRTLPTLFFYGDMSERTSQVLMHELTHRRASAHNALAWYLAWDRGRVDDALPHATEAIRDFACFECFDTLAFVLSKKGAFARALQLQTIAVNTAPDGFSAPEMLDRWEHYRRAAAQSPGQVKASAPP